MTEILGTATKIKTANGSIDIVPTTPTVGQCLVITSPTEARFMTPDNFFNATFIAPTEWGGPLPALPSDDRFGFVGRIRVSRGANRVAIKFSFGIDIDWGDGTTESYPIYTPNPVARHIFPEPTGNDVVYYTVKITGASTSYSVPSTIELSATDPELTSLSNVTSPTASAQRGLWVEAKIKSPGVPSGGFWGGVENPMLESFELNLYYYGTTSANLLVPNKAGIKKATLKIGSSYVNGLFHGCGELIEATVNQSGQSASGSGTNVFYGCKKLSKFPTITFANSVTDFTGIFYECENAKNLSNYNLTKATNLTNAFYGCKRMEVLPVMNLPIAVNTTGCFEGCLSLPPSACDVTLTNATNITAMYRNAARITSLKINAPLASSVADLVTGCTMLNNLQLDIPNHLSTITITPSRPYDSLKLNIKKLFSAKNFGLWKEAMNDLFSYLPVITTRAKIIVSGNYSNFRAYSGTATFTAGSTSVTLGGMSCPLSTVLEIGDVIEFIGDCFTSNNIASTSGGVTSIPLATGITGVKVNANDFVSLLSFTSSSTGASVMVTKYSSDHSSANATYYQTSKTKVASTTSTSMTISDSITHGSNFVGVFGNESVDLKSAIATGTVTGINGSTITIDSPALVSGTYFLKLRHASPTTAFADAFIAENKGWEVA